MMDTRDPLSNVDWLTEHFGLLFAAADPQQQFYAWVMFFAVAGFPLWFVGYSLYTLARKRWYNISPAALFATAFHAGWMRPMPGTWGSLFAVWLLVGLIFAPKETSLSAGMIPIILFAATILVIPLGTWASELYVRHTKKEDPSEVVIDEVAGIFVAASVVAAGFIALVMSDAVTFTPFLFLWPAYLAVIFLLFRIFDITKPWIIGRADRNIKGGWGIMADDLLAGLAAGLVFWLIFAAMYHSGGFLWIFKTYFPDWVGPAPTTPLPESAPVPGALKLLGQ